MAKENKKPNCSCEGIEVQVDDIPRPCTLMTPEEYAAWYKATFSDDDNSYGDMSVNHDRGQRLFDKAFKTINGERQQAYGNPEDSFVTIGAMWSTALGIPVTREKSMLLMVLFKLSRELHNEGGHEDNIIDAAGYLALYHDAMYVDRKASK